MADEYGDKLTIPNWITSAPDAGKELQVGEEGGGGDVVNRPAKANFDFIKQLTSGAIGQNLLKNGDMEIWSAGTSSAPDNWTLTGTGATVARSSTKKRGSYAAQVTYGSADAYLYQDYADYVYFQSGKVTVGVWVKCSTASIARLIINDGVGTTASSYHTGGGSYELLEVTRTIDGSASQLRIELHVENTGNAIFDIVKLEEGEIATAFSPHPNDEHETPAESVLGSTFNISAANGTWQDTGLAMTLPGAGTYLVYANVRASLESSATASNLISAKLYNSTDAADISNSERLIAFEEDANVLDQASASIIALAFVTASKTIKLYAMRDNGTWINSDIVSDADGRTTIGYIKLK